MEPIAEYLIRLLVTLAVLILVVELVSIGVLALRGLHRSHHHAPSARPGAA